MITKEEASNFLKQKEIPEFKKTLLKKVSALSGDAKMLGLLLLNDVSEVKDHSSYYQNWPSLGHLRKASLFKLFSDEIEGLDPWEGKLYATLQALFEDKATYVREGWKLQTNLMYQSGWHRRSFRAPKSPILLIGKKIDWLAWLPYCLRYDMSLPDYVRYAGYMNTGMLSPLFAGASMTDTEEGRLVYQRLLDSVYGRDDVAIVERDVVKALLISDRPEGWEAVEKLLLAAQRQEGLRQTIFESLDETSPDAFKHFLKVILDNDLGRFSSTVRALDVWVGFEWESPRTQTVNRALELGLDFLTHPEKIEDAAFSKDNLVAYLALWAKGCHDVVTAISLAKRMLDSDEVMHQALALMVLRSTCLPRTIGPITYPFLKSKNLMVAALALFTQSEYPKEEFPNAFEDLAALWGRIPEKGIVFSGKIFDWYQVELRRTMVMGKMIAIAVDNNPEQLAPFYDQMDAGDRSRFSHILAQRSNFTPELREIVFKMLAERDGTTRDNAFKVLEKFELRDNENRSIEALLTRKSADLRLGALKVLMRQPDAELLGSAFRLLNSKDGQQQLGGLDILSQLVKNQRLNDEAIRLAKSYQERPKLSDKERIILKDILTSTEIQYTAENGYGVYDPKMLTVSPPPQPQPKISQSSSALNNILPFKKEEARPELDLSWDEQLVATELKVLDGLIEQHKNFEYQYEEWNGERATTLVGNEIKPIIKFDAGKTPRQHLENLPLWEVWDGWWKGCRLTPWHLERLMLPMHGWGYGLDNVPGWIKELEKIYTTDFGLYHNLIQLKYLHQIRMLLFNIAINYLPENATDLRLGMAEDMLASIPAEGLNEFFQSNRYHQEKATWRDMGGFSRWLHKAKEGMRFFTENQISRLWHLNNWVYQTAESKKDDYRPDLPLTMLAFEKKIINEHDVADKIFNSIQSLGWLSQSENVKVKGVEAVTEFFEKYPGLRMIFQRCVGRILEIELQRGDSETVVTSQAVSLARIEGIGYLVQILQALGEDTLTKGYVYWHSRRQVPKNEVLSHLLQRCFPKMGETAPDFSQAFKIAGIKEKRMVEVAMYAPQWVPFIEKYLGWKGMGDAIWWFHAHTKEAGYSIKEKWESDLNRFTPLLAQDLVDGGVDVTWFHQAYKTVGKARWEQLYDAAKYVSDGNGHTRARLFADAMLGNTDFDSLAESISQKRKQDSVRALGLLPLDRRNPQKDMLRRYQLVQQFKKGSKQFGNQRQVSEALAVRIGLENLARTAGYSDPIRLTWAMETREAQEILQNAEVFEKDGVRICLQVDDMGQASVFVEKEGKQLSSVPAKFRKEKTVLELYAQAKTLRDQYKRTRKALEDAMCRGDLFELSEIEQLSSHPVVAPMLRYLVLVTKDGNGIGFYKDKTLQNPSHNVYSILNSDKLRLAHCSDLYRSGLWSDFQRMCFVEKKVQPFKQVFRELYLPTPDELRERTVSRRYAGHQVNPAQTVALLKGRGWTVDYDEGLQRVFHKENFVVRLYAQTNWLTPAEVEPPVLETLHFHRRDSYQDVPFEEVPPIIFSEIMRDVDLVVSVAHLGGVDPEASHSTMEMRRVLVRETATLLGLKNIRVEGNHILIAGELGDYSIHLGSGVVHRQPGGYISVIAVHGQHRGRLFLPFVDDDPKSAEILSKTLLLAEDKKIKDPTILRQLVG